MTVRVFYVDESYDENKFCLTGISMRHHDWHECFNKVREHRSLLKQDHGIYIRKEIHATEFVSGRGRIADRVIGKHLRSRIFKQLLTQVAQLPHIYLINICLDVRGRANPQLDAWERLVNRIERTMLEYERKELPKRRRLVSAVPSSYPAANLIELSDRVNDYCPRAVIYADEGRELEITKTLRKMRIFNPIPSRFGTWPTGAATQNIQVKRLIEDPSFKKSHQSFFLQLADCVAFALLKREVEPSGHVKRYGIHKMFEDCLSEVCLKAASPRDPLGIVRN